MSTEKTNKTMRIAVCSFQDRVCPRFDITPEILVFPTKRSQEEPTEKLPVSQIPPEKVINLLLEKNVGTVIVGGMQKEYQEMLLSSNIGVIWGVAGKVRDVVHAYLRNTLHSGIGIVPELEQ